MKKILLVCSAGMSTSILVDKMKAAALERNIECVIEAHGNQDVKRFAGKFDVCMLGPQIRYAKAQVVKDIAPTPVDVIDIRSYGTANGVNVLETALALIESTQH